MAYQNNFDAFLRENGIIEVSINKKLNAHDIQNVRLYENKKFIKKLERVSKTESKSTFIYSFKLDYVIVPGRLYELANEHNEFSPLNISSIVFDEEFERKYRYEGELGAIYSKERTIFRVFSPLASSGVVKVFKRSEDEAEYFTFRRIEGGVLEAVAEGDYDGAGYLFIVKINGYIVSVVDPYAKSLGSNSRCGFVINEESVKDIDLNYDKLPVLKSWNYASVYELDVRDMTSLTNIEGKGTYSALCLEGQKDQCGNPIGFDYITSLNFTHIQLLPVYDFQTIDDDNPSSMYNWGYDPLFYFAPEGSYSSSPSSAYARVRELRKVVSSFHKKGMRVNMDVVFNHTFSPMSNSFEALCPNYYYRFNNDKTMSNGSMCGNDLETRNFMVRKLIIDALVYFVKMYGMDGFRFDLMGIIDKVTLKKAWMILKSIKPDIMFYGEGWDMPTALESHEKSSMNNAFDLENIGFFNDRFRDTARGKSNDIKGYLNGDLNYRDGFKHVFLGSTISIAYPPLFAHPHQSINYVECHDNSTLFDKMVCSNGHEDEVTRLKRVKLFNAAIILSYGIPFIHAGQEVGLSKNGVENSYNSGDSINGFKYDVAYSRKNMISFINDAIKLKRYSRLFSLDNKNEIEKVLDFEDLPNGALAVHYFDAESERKIVAIINPSNITVKYQFDKYYKIIFNEAGWINEENYSQLVLVNGITLLVAVSTK